MCGVNSYCTTRDYRKGDLQQGFWCYWVLVEGMHWLFPHSRLEWYTRYRNLLRPLNSVGANRWALFLMTERGECDIKEVHDWLGVTLSHNCFFFCTLRLGTMVSSGTKRAAFEGKLYLKNIDCRLIKVYIVALFLASQVGRHTSTQLISVIYSSNARQLCITPCEWACSFYLHTLVLKIFYPSKVGNRCYGSR